MEKIKNRALKAYLNVVLVTYSSHKKEFTPKDTEEIINAIRAFSPNVLFVGMTAPKQMGTPTRAIFRQMRYLCFGVVFNSYADTVKRPTKVWQNLGWE